MPNQKTDAQPYGAPLAICINDCEIDHGQWDTELANICFRVNCAFAEMRWGDIANTNQEDDRWPLQPCRISPAK